MAPRNRRKPSGATHTPLGQATGRKRPSEGRTTTGQGRTPFDNNRAPQQSPALPKEVTRTSSLLSLYEAQSVEHVAAGGGGFTGGRDNGGPFLDEDGGTLLGLGGSFSGISHGLTGRRGERLAHRAFPASKDQRQGQEARERKAGPAETGEGGDCPWSDERRASWSRGSGGAATRHPGRGNIDPGVPRSEPRDDLRWDDVLGNGELDGLSAVTIRNGDGGSSVIDGDGSDRGGEPNAGTAGSLALVPLLAEGEDRIDRPALFSQPSPRKPSSVQRRREHLASPARAAPDSAEEADQPHLNGDRHRLNREVGGAEGVAGAGTRFSLRSSSDEDASVTEVLGGDEDGDSAIGGAGYDVQAGGPSRLASRWTTATGGYDAAGGAFISMTASAGSFFDAATSSADKVCACYHRSFVSIDFSQSCSGRYADDTSLHTENGFGVAGHWAAFHVAVHGSLKVAKENT